MSIDWRSSALMVYSPDAVLSGQTDALDEMVRRRTQLGVARKFLAIHDEQSIDDFYGLSGKNDTVGAELVYRLFVARPAVVLLWHGRDALAKLQRIKGDTHPAAAEPGTVRSRFWCDNPICNLIHVSDTVTDMDTEFGILSQRRVAELNGALISRGVGGPTCHNVRHNALLEFRRVLHRNCLGRMPAANLLDLPRSGGAVETAHLLFHDLNSLVETCSTDIANLIRYFLTGNDQFPGLFREVLRDRSDWEDLVISCGLGSNRQWSQRLSLDIGSPREGAPVRAAVRP